MSKVFAHLCTHRDVSKRIIWIEVRQLQSTVLLSYCPDCPGDFPRDVIQSDQCFDHVIVVLMRDLVFTIFFFTTVATASKTLGVFPSTEWRQSPVTLSLICLVNNTMLTIAFVLISPTRAAIERQRRGRKSILQQSCVVISSSINIICVIHLSCLFVLIIF